MDHAAQERVHRSDDPDSWPPAVPSAVGPAEVVVVRATGPDRLTYLDAVLSQRLGQAAPGTATAALELGPNGEPNGVADIAVLEDEVVLLVPSALADDVIGRLAGRTFLSEVSFERDDGVAAARLRGPQAHGDAREADLGTPVGTATVADGVLRLGDPHGVWLVGDPTDVDGCIGRLGGVGVQVTEDASHLDALEVLTGRPRAPEEIARGRLPEELGLLPTHVHLAKGCYPGQEAVARMWQLGRPRKRLAVLSGSEPIAVGTHGEGRGAIDVTRQATVGDHHVAIGFGPRDVAVGDRPTPGLVVRAVVGDDQPVPGHDPAVRRRRDTR